MSSSRVNLLHFQMSLSEILSATQYFSKEYLVGSDGFGKVYKAEIEAHDRYVMDGKAKRRYAAAVKRYDDHHGKDMFLSELAVVIRLHHENITSFIGYCDEKDEMIVVYEYASNGSLDIHLSSPDRRGQLIWAKRLKICLDVARGLNFLHSSLGEDNVVIHRDVKTSNILLDENLQAKISDFALSKSVPRNKPNVCEPAVGTAFYVDPIYAENNLLKVESDIYSLGVVLFEMLSGMLAYDLRSFGDDEPQPLINLVRRYYDDGLHKLIDPLIRDEINSHSFRTFTEVAYKCISFNLKDRPTAYRIIERLEEALKIQLQGADSTNTPLSRQYQNLENFLIPLKEIIRATRNFSAETQISDGGSKKIYKRQLAKDLGKETDFEYGEFYTGKLSERWKSRTAVFRRLDQNDNSGKKNFLDELEMVSRLSHEHIIPFIGYCDQGSEMIIVYEYAMNQSLQHHLQDPGKSRLITWAQRLKICLGAARGLRYLQSGLGEDKIVIHNNIKSGSVLLDENLEAKISGFGWSVSVPRNQPQVYKPVARTQYVLDPIYRESGVLKTETDVYSFGLILFEMLSGILASNQTSIGDDQSQNLISLVRSCYDHGLDKLIDPNIRDQIDSRSLHTFKEIAYKCISFSSKDRPSMKRIARRIQDALDIQNRQASSNSTKGYQDLDSYLIPLKDIKAVTDDFSGKTLAGDGGFGFVHRGKFSERAVAIKRLNHVAHQGNTEFRNELALIFRFHHQNIIPLIGYCDQDNEMIIITEFANNGSLDRHLEDPVKRSRLTWKKRLEICIGAAAGIDYLHSGFGEDNRVIHRDIKSANILLDDNLEPKICDFGLSKTGPRNEADTKLYTKAAGTYFYMDPIYSESGILRKESDVYSFGVVLFEMLTGLMAYRAKVGDSAPQPLINLVRRYYGDGLDKLIDDDIQNHIDARSYHTFKNIAYQCISMNIQERPTMDMIIDSLEDALEFQVIWESEAKAEIEK